MSGTQQLNKQARRDRGSLFGRNFNLHAAIVLLLDDARIRIFQAVVVVFIYLPM